MKLLLNRDLIDLPASIIQVEQGGKNVAMTRTEKRLRIDLRIDAIGDHLACIFAHTSSKQCTLRFDTMGLLPVHAVEITIL